MTPPASALLATMFASRRPDEVFRLEGLPPDRRPKHLVLNWKDPSKAHANAVQHRDACDIYVGVALFQAKTKDRQVEHVSRLPAVWADVDFGTTKVHKTREEALSAISDLLLEPTAIVETGHGFHVWWLLAKPTEPDDPNATTTKQRFPRHHAMVRAVGEYLGGDLVADAARLLRIPGTLNHKATPAIPVELVEIHPDRVYELEDFEALGLPIGTNDPRSKATTDGHIANNRNVALTRMGGRMRYAGMEQAEIEATLQAVNRKRCDPPLDDGEVRRIADSISKYPPNDRQLLDHGGLGDLQHRKAAFAPEGLTQLSSVEPEILAWLWPGYIPLAKVSLVDGDPDLGKSTLTTDLASRASTGSAMPDGSLGDLDGPVDVILLTCEDGLADTVRPRVDAAGGEPGRIHALEWVLKGDDQRMPSLDDIEALKGAIIATRARLVIVDPLMAYLPSNVHSYRDQDVRRVLGGLSQLAEETGVAMVVIRHLNKSGGQPAVYRGGGSIGIIAAARAGLLVARHPNEPEKRILAVTKLNLAKKPPSWSFRIVEDGLAARIEWVGKVEVDVDALVSGPADAGERSAIDEAAQFISRTLRTGAVAAREVKDRAREAGISPRTLERAKQRLGVRSRRDGLSWVWELPARGEPGEDRQDRQNPAGGDDGKLPVTKACANCGAAASGEYGTCDRCRDSWEPAAMGHDSVGSDALADATQDSCVECGCDPCGYDSEARALCQEHFAAWEATRR